MSFTDAELYAHCDEIITDPAIRNRIIVLCEGDTKPFKPTPKALSIGQFSQRTQDSAFYYRAIPEWWKTTRKLEPSFYVCGTQGNVIKAYCYLKQKHQQQPKESYLNFNKLFALLDIDVQKTRLPCDYHSFKNLEDIYHDLYLNGKVNPNTATNHKLWVTGLLHKEAYFLIPETKELFNSHQPEPFFNTQSLKLEDIYQAILNTMPNHTDIEKNFNKAMNRIAYCGLFNQYKTIDEFQKAWQNYFDNSKTEEEKVNLIYMLLTVAKSKSVWEEIKPNADNIDIKNYRDELCFKIAREFYAKQSSESLHHLPSFFNALSAIA
jgi:hypothetical protein